MNWNDISNSPDYINADGGTKYKIKSDYFDSYIAPELPLALRGANKKRWMEVDSGQINVAPPTSSPTPEVRSQPRTIPSVASKMPSTAPVGPSPSFYPMYGDEEYTGQEIEQRASKEALRIGEPELERAAYLSQQQQQNLRDHRKRAIIPGSPSHTLKPKDIQAALDAGEPELAHAALTDYVQQNGPVQSARELAWERDKPLNATFRNYLVEGVKDVPRSFGYWIEGASDYALQKWLDEGGSKDSLYYQQIENETRDDAIIALAHKEGFQPRELERVGGLKQVFLDATRAVPAMVAAVPAGAVAGPVGSGVVMGGQILGSSYEEQIKAGVNPREAFKSSALNAAIQGPMESIGLGKAMKVWSATGKGFTKFAKKLAEAGVTEAATEYLQEYPDHFTKTITINKAKGMTDMQAIDAAMAELPEVAKQAAQSGLVGGVMGVGMAGAGGAVKGAGRAVTAPTRAIREMERDLSLGIRSISDGEARPDSIDSPTPIMSEAATQQQEWAATKRQEFRDLGFTGSQANAVVNALNNLDYNPDQVKLAPYAWIDENGNRQFDQSKTSFDTFEEAQQVADAWFGNSYPASGGIITKNESGKYVVVPRINLRKDKIIFQRKNRRYFENETPVIDQLESLVNSTSWKYHWLFKEAIDAGFDTRIIVTDQDTDSNMITDNSVLGSTASARVDPVNPNFNTVIALNGRAMEMDNNLESAATTLVHEQIHSLLRHKVGRLNSKEVQALHKDLQNVWVGIKPDVISNARKFAQRNPGRGFTYLLNSMEQSMAGDLKATEELVTIALTRPDVAKWLDSIPVEGSKGRTTSLWKKLTQLVARLINPNKTKMDEVLEVLDKHAGIGIGRNVNDQKTGAIKSVVDNYKSNALADVEADTQILNNLGQIDPNISYHIRNADSQTHQRSKFTSKLSEWFRNRVASFKLTSLRAKRFLNYELNDQYAPIREVSEQAYREVRLFSSYKDLAEMDVEELLQEMGPLRNFPKVLSSYFKLLRDNVRARDRIGTDKPGFLSPGYERDPNWSDDEYRQYIEKESLRQADALIENTSSRTRLTRKITRKDFDQAVEAWTKWNDKRLQILVDSGLLSEKNRNNMRKDNPFYATFELKDKLGDQIRYYRSTRNIVDMPESFTQGISDATADVRDVIGATRRKDMAIRSMAARNKVATALANDLTSVLNQNDLRKLDKQLAELSQRPQTVERDVALVELKRTIQNLSIQQVFDSREEASIVNQARLDKLLADKYAPPSVHTLEAIGRADVDTKNQSIMKVWDNGVLKEYAISKDIHDLLDVPEQMHIFWRIVGFPNQQLKQLFTTLSLPFAIRNVKRDLDAALVGGDTWKGKRFKSENPLIRNIPVLPTLGAYLRALGKAGVYELTKSDTPLIVRAPFTAVFDKVAPGFRQKTNEELRKYFESGGGLGFTGIEKQSPNPSAGNLKLNQDIRALFNRDNMSWKTLGPVGAAAKVGGRVVVSPFKLVAKLNQALEMMPRLAAFEETQSLITKSRKEWNGSESIDQAGKQLYEEIEDLYNEFVKERNLIEKRANAGQITLKDAEMDHENNENTYQTKVLETYDKHRKRLYELADKAAKNEVQRRYLKNWADLITQYAHELHGTDALEEQWDKFKDQLSAFQARESTLDFSKMGRAMRYVNHVIPFSNAAMRGFGKLVSALYGYDRRAKNRFHWSATRMARNWLTLMTLSAMTGYMFQAAYYLLGDDDDENLKWYFKVPLFERLNNYIIVYGTTEDEKTGEEKPAYFKIPKSEYSKIFNVGEAMLWNALGVNDNADAVDVAKETFFDIAAPAKFVGASEEGFTTDNLTRLLPFGFKVIVELFSNRNSYRGKDLESPSMRKKPVEQRYYSSTPEFYKELSKLTVGTPIELSPIQLHHAGRGLAGKYGDDPIEAFKWGLPTAAQLPETFTGNYDWAELDYKREQTKELKTNWEHSRRRIAVLIQDGKGSAASKSIRRYNRQLRIELRDLDGLTRTERSNVYDALKLDSAQVKRFIRNSERAKKGRQKKQN